MEESKKASIDMDQLLKQASIDNDPSPRQIVESYPRSWSIFPNELWGKIASNLDYRDWSNLKGTCKFFNEEGAAAIKGNRNIVPLVVKIITGYQHTFVLFSDGQLYGCGENKSGELGLGDQKKRSAFTRIPIENIKGIGKNTFVRQVVATEDATFILFSDNRLFACGENYHGQLGLGDQKNRSVFTQVMIKDMDKDAEILKVIAGPAHTFVLLSNNKLYACGMNSGNQLGLSAVNNQSVFTQICIEGMGDDVRIKEVATGDQHSFFLLSNGELYGCGKNQFMQLGLGDQKKRVVFTRIPIGGAGEPIRVQRVIAAGNHSFILLNNDKWYACGRNHCGQLGLDDTEDEPLFTQIRIKGVHIQGIIAGVDNTFMLSRTGELYACGQNCLGQLGLGHTDKQLVFGQVPIVDIKDNISILQVAIGAAHTFVRLSNNALYVCGDDPRLRWGTRVINPQVVSAPIAKFICCNSNLLLLQAAKKSNDSLASKK